MKCLKCGKDNPDNAKFCSGCGALLQKQAEVEPVKKRKTGKKKIWIVLIVLILAILLLGVYFLSKERKSVKEYAENVVEIFQNGDKEKIDELIFGYQELAVEDESQEEGEKEGILAKIFKNISVKVKRITGKEIQYEISSPDLSTFFDTLEKENKMLSASEMESSLDKLIKEAQRKEYVVSIPYEKKNGKIIAAYRTEEFVNAITGGLLESYKEIYAKMLEEWK
ncbi:MAG: zinc ribbon domain-containing protein [Bacillota bacterium]|nr:zinc ribbon domain-containing protein [Bacillota bacterium]